MKKSLYLLGLITIVSLSAFTFITDSTPEDTTMRLEITSMDESQEITFSGHYFSRTHPDRGEQFKEHKTPYIIEMEAVDTIALFKKVEGDADIRVKMSLLDENGESTSSARSSGEVSLVMYENGNLMATGI